MRPTKYGQPLAKPRSFRLPENDDAALAAKIAASGLEFSEFIRDYVLRDRTTVIARAPKLSSQAGAEQRRLIGLIGASGNNLNQLARRANTDYQAGIISAATYEAVLQQLEAISLYLHASLPRC